MFSKIYKFIFHYNIWKVSKLNTTSSTVHSGQVHLKKEIAQWADKFSTDALGEMLFNHL